MSLLPNTVINGNCLEVMKEIDDASIDMILCDLPYGATQNSWDSVIKWSPASQLPEYAIRRKAIVTKFEYKPLRSFTADDIKLLRLDYASQDDPQLLMEEYLPIKNFELLYGWWKQHYKATLKDCDNPQAIILHLASTD